MSVNGSITISPTYGSRHAPNIYALDIVSNTINCSGGRIRTYDLKLMKLAS